MSETQTHVDGHAYFIRKPMDYLEVMQSTLSKHHHLFSKPVPYKIVKTIELSGDEFRAFTDNNILKDQAFLKTNTDSCYVNKDGIWQALKVVNKDNPSESLLVQTEGSSYARYVAIEKYYSEVLKQQIYDMTAYNNSFVPKGNQWYEGKIDGCTVYAKVYPKPSKYGIDNGRISKLTIKDKDNHTIINYDRGWDKKPDAQHLNIYKKVLVTLEHIRPKEKNKNQER